MRRSGETDSRDTGGAGFFFPEAASPSAAQSAFTASSAATLENLDTRGFLAAGVALSHALVALSCARRCSSERCLSAVSSSKPSNPESGSALMALNTHPCFDLYSCMSFTAFCEYSHPFPSFPGRV